MGVLFCKFECCFWGRASTLTLLKQHDLTLNIEHTSYWSELTLFSLEKYMLSKKKSRMMHWRAQQVLKNGWFRDIKHCRTTNGEIEWKPKAIEIHLAEMQESTLDGGEKPLLWHCFCIFMMKIQHSVYTKYFSVFISLASLKCDIYL